jgi:protein TonB
MPFRLKNRQRRALIVFGTGSVILHAVLLDALPGFEAPDVPEARVLDVVLVSPPAPPIAAPPIVTPPAKAPPEPPKPVDRAEKPKPPAKKKRPEEPRPRSGEAPPALSSEEMTAVPSPPSFAVPPAPPSRAPDVGARSTAPSQAKADITPPAFNASYLRNPAPRYPLIARRNGEQGTVTLRVLVTREGTPARVSVEQTSGSRHLDEAALDAVKGWRFVPARRGNEEVEAWVVVPIVFRLESAS